MKPANGTSIDRAVSALDEYLAAQRKGKPLSKSEFLARHPDLKEELEGCLEGLELIASAPDDKLDQSIIGGELGDFRIVGEIGRGGMGVVYEAEQISLGRKVALKVLPFAAVFDERHLQRFKNEAQAAAFLHHTNIVPVFAVGCERGVHYYAMQHIEGRSFAQILEELRGSPKESSAELGAISGDKSTESAGYCRAIARLGIQAAEALDHAHERGVVHRDIKPANLMLDRHAHVWITDFGLASFERNTGLTMTGDLIGTVRYMSPEQAMAKRIPIDHRTDIYSLGATIYELMTLKPAHPGEDPHAVMRAIAFEEPTSARRLNPALPVELETVLLKAMAKDPQARYDSAEDFANDLRRFLEHKPIHARRPSLLDKTTKWARRHRIVVGGAMIVLLLAVVGLAVGNALVIRERNRTAEALAQADANFDRAVAAVDRMLVELGAKWLADAPYMAPARRRLFEEALVLFQQFLEQEPDRPELHRRVAETFGRVGTIRRLLGQSDQAATAFEQAVAGFRALDDHDALADCLRDLGRLRRERIELEEAEKIAREVLALRPRGVGRAAALRELGEVLRLRGREEDGVLALRQAVAELEQATPTDEVRAALASTVGQLARTLLGSSPAEVRDLVARARRVWEDVLQRSSKAQHRAQFAQLLQLETWLDEETEEPEAQRASLERIVALLEGLVNEDPSVPHHRERLASVCGVMALQVGPQRLDWAERAVKVSRELIGQFPHVERYRWRLALSLRILGYVQGNLTERAYRSHRESRTLLQGLAEEFGGAQTKEALIIRRGEGPPMQVQRTAFGGWFLWRERPDYRNHLGISLRVEFWALETLREYRKARELIPLFDPPRPLLARFLLMCPDRSLRDPALALDLLNRMEDHLAYGVRAIAHLRNGNLERANEFMTKALERPRNWDSGTLPQLFHALVQHASGETDAARATARRARAEAIRMERAGEMDGEIPYLGLFAEEVAAEVGLRD